MNPLEQLKNLVSGNKPRKGIVVSLAGGFAQIATSRGLVEYKTIDSLIIGDTVIITGDGQLLKPSTGGAVYYV